MVPTKHKERREIRFELYCMMFESKVQIVIWIHDLLLLKGFMSVEERRIGC